MPFKVKDLLVDVASATNALQCYPTFICHFGCSFHIYSGCHNYCTYLVQSICHYGCTNHFPSICQHGSVTVTVTCPGTLVTDTTPIIQTTPQYSGPALINLKEQLKAALEIAEKQSVAEADALQPQTLADVEMLETKMGEALEALKARKAELKKK
ncbi:MAG TPA: hypothetical protein VGK29_14635 [Paludibaculum sp.]|jgi:hypothetical protein